MPFLRGFSYTVNMKSASEPRPRTRGSKEKAFQERMTRMRDNGNESDIQILKKREREMKDDVSPMLQ